MLDLLERAEREAQRERSNEVKLEHLLNALSQEIRGPAGEVMGAFGVAPGSLRNHTGALGEVKTTGAGARWLRARTRSCATSWRSRATPRPTR